ncbi:MAG: DUF4924 family protein [Rikenellaceae bacterium]|nr:DUF4924 family protein [Rikenellaceae bacterium]
MDIAQQKRKENIAEYILYLWQIEDLLRALQFSPEAIYSTLVKPRKLDSAHEQVLLAWYMDIAELLAQEQKEQSGHLNHTLHLISDLHDLHLRLMQQEELGESYRQRYAQLVPHLSALRSRLGKESDMSDTELCFRALYAAMLYRIKGEGENAVTDTIEVISPFVALLADYYHKVERGEIDLFKE